MRFSAADGHMQEMRLTPDFLANAFLAYELDGEPLPVLTGFPVRLVWPGHTRRDWTKWVVAIEVL